MSLDLSARNIDRNARLLVPRLLLILLLLFNMVAMPLPFGHAVKTHLLVMAIYYWSVTRPELVPPVLCLALGLAMDILGGYPPGLNAIVLTALQWLIQDRRRMLIGQPYPVTWAVFGLVAAGSSALQWALGGLAEGRWVPLQPMLSGTLISVLLFPVVTMILFWAQRLLPNGQFSPVEVPR